MARRNQRIAILRKHEVDVAAAEVCRKHDVSSATFYKWKAKFGGREVSEARRLKRTLMDAMLDNTAEGFSGNSGETCRQTGGHAVSYCDLPDEQAAGMLGLWGDPGGRALRGNAARRRHASAAAKELAGERRHFSYRRMASAALWKERMLSLFETPCRDASCALKLDPGAASKR